MIQEFPVCWTGVSQNRNLQLFDVRISNEKDVIIDGNTAKN